MVDRKTDLFDCLQKASSIDLAFLESGKEFEFFLISNEKQQVNDFIEIRKAFERKIIALFEKGLIKRLPFRHLTKLSPGQREGFSGEEVIGGNLVTQDFGFPKILILRLTRQIAFEVKRGTRSDPLRQGEKGEGLEERVFEAMGKSALPRPRHSSHDDDL